MQYKAVIFDLDGTLLNTIDDISDAVNLALKNNNHAEHSIEDFKNYVGEGIVTLAKNVLPADTPQDYVVKFAGIMQEEYKKCWNNKTKIYKGIDELLDELVNRRIPIAIFSNKPHEFTLLNVVQYLSKWRFKVVLGATKSKPQKPNPQVSFEIAKTLGICPDEIIHLGDTGVDMQTAIAANMFPLGVSWGFRSREELIQDGARSVIDHPMELMKYVL